MDTERRLFRSQERRTAIANAVRAELARAGKTQGDLGEFLGLAQPSVSLRLTGRRAFRGEELATIARWLGVPVATFFGRAA